MDNRPRRRGHEARQPERTAVATYARYNALLDSAWLKDTLGIIHDPNEVAKIAEMDNPSNMDELENIGKAAAAKQINAADHFPAAFDIPRSPAAAPR